MYPREEMDKRNTHSTRWFPPRMQYDSILLYIYNFVRCWLLIWDRTWEMILRYLTNLLLSFLFTNGESKSIVVGFYRDRNMITSSYFIFIVLLLLVILAIEQISQTYTVNIISEHYPK